MKKKFRSVKRKKPVIRDKYLFDRGWRRSFFEYSRVFKRARLRLQLPNFSVWFKQATGEELKITPRVWFLRSGVGVLSHPNPNRKQLIVVSITARVNLIYGKKPKSREWNQIQKFIQTNRLAIQRHWNETTSTCEFASELVDLNGESDEDFL